VEEIELVEDEFKVEALGGYRDAVFAIKTRGDEFTCQGISR